MAARSQQIITLNRRRILREVSESVGFAIHSEGLERGHDGKYTAWISLKVPLVGDLDQTITEMVSSRPNLREEDAKQEAAEEAIRKIVATGTIIINDINYAALRGSSTNRWRCIHTCNETTAATWHTSNMQVQLVCYHKYGPSAATPHIPTTPENSALFSHSLYCSGHAMAAGRSSMEFPDQDVGEQRQESLAVVRVPRRTILQSVASTLGLNVHGTGYERGATRSITAWVDMDLPRRSGEPHARRRLFHSQPCHSLAAAEENAAQAVLDYLCAHTNVVIDDYNYGALCTARSSIASTQEWAQTKEFHIKLARQETFRTQKEYVRRMKILEKICAKFTDILPFTARVFGTRGSSSRCSDVDLTYIGSDPPQTRLEELACHIHHLLTGADGASVRLDA